MLARPRPGLAGPDPGPTDLALVVPCPGFGQGALALSGPDRSVLASLALTGLGPDRPCPVWPGGLVCPVLGLSVRALWPTPGPVLSEVEGTVLTLSVPCLGCLPVLWQTGLPGRHVWQMVRPGPVEYSPKWENPSGQGYSTGLALADPTRPSLPAKLNLDFSRKAGPGRSGPVG